MAVRDRTVFDGFLSYARIDDTHGDVGKLHAAIQIDLQQRWKRNCSLFIDKGDIHVGQTWRNVIDQGLSESSFLIALISPSFITSPECQAEVRAFQEKAYEAGKEPYIFPILTVEVLESDRNEFYKELASTQFADYTKIRFKDASSEQFREFVTNTAIELIQGIRLPRPAQVRTVSELKGTIDKYEAIISGYEEKVIALQVKEKQFVGEIEALTKDVITAKREAVSNQDDKQPLLDRIKDLEGKLEAAAENQTQENSMALTKKLEDVKRSHKQELDEVLSKHKKAIENYESLIVDLREKVDSLEEEIITLHTSTKNKQDSRDGQIQSLQEELKLAKQEIEKEREQGTLLLKDALSKIDNLESSAGKNSKALATKSEELAKAKKKATELEKSLAEAKSAAPVVAAGGDYSFGIKKWETLGICALLWILCYFVPSIHLWLSSGLAPAIQTLVGVNAAVLTILTFACKEDLGDLIPCGFSIFVQPIIGVAYLWWFFGNTEFGPWEHWGPFVLLAIHTVVSAGILGAIEDISSDHIWFGS